MPLKISVQHAQGLVVPLHRHEAAVRPNVAERDHVDFKQSELSREGHLLFMAEMLARKNKQRTREPRIVKLLLDFFIDGVELYPADDCAKGGVNRIDLHCHAYFLPLRQSRWILDLFKGPVKFSRKTIVDGNHGRVSL